MTTVAFPKPEPRPKKPRRPLQAKARLERKTPLRARRWGVSRGPSKRTRERTGEAQRYLDFLHSRTCVLSGFDCRGSIQQSHARNIDGLPTGTGRKENDFASVPMCREHHMNQWERDSSTPGHFQGWTQDQRRAFMVREIAKEWLAFQEAGGVIPEEVHRAYGLFVRVEWKNAAAEARRRG